MKIENKKRLGFVLSFLPTALFILAIIIFDAWKEMLIFLNALGIGFIFVYGLILIGNNK